MKTGNSRRCCRRRSCRGYHCRDCRRRYRSRGCLRCCCLCCQSYCWRSTTAIRRRPFSSVAAVEPELPTYQVSRTRTRTLPPLLPPSPSPPLPLRRPPTRRAMRKQKKKPTVQRDCCHSKSSALSLSSSVAQLVLVSEPSEAEAVEEKATTGAVLWCRPSSHSARSACRWCAWPFL